MANLSVRDKIMDVVAVVAVACLVLLVVGTFTRRGSPLPPPFDTTLSIAPVDNWLEITDGGRHLGEPEAPVTIAVFMDFECPACRSFVLGPERRIWQQFSGALRLVVRHMPLSYHRLASPAACAAEQGQFEEMYGLLFEKQDSLGLKDFASFAEESGVGDLPAFDECLSSERVQNRISADLELADRSGAAGTPTVIVYGLRLSRPPTADELVELVQEHLGREEA